MMTHCEKRAEFLRLTMSVPRQVSIRSLLDATIELEMRQDLRQVAHSEREQKV
jgi:hypothetical protein